MTSGTARTFFTHSVSPRVDTRYFTPSTSGTTTGILCGCLLIRLVTVSVSLPPTPVAIAILLNTVRVNHGGLRYAMSPEFDGRYADAAMAGTGQPVRHQPHPEAVGRLGADVRHSRPRREEVGQVVPDPIDGVLHQYRGGDPADLWS